MRHRRIRRRRPSCDRVNVDNEDVEVSIVAIVGTRVETDEGQRGKSSTACVVIRVLETGVGTNRYDSEKRVLYSKTGSERIGTHEDSISLYVRGVQERRM